MNKEEIVNEVMGSFKMTVDTKGLKKLEKYIDNLELENQELKDRINKAINKINNMFEVGDENKIIDDLLELEKILKGDNKE